MLVIETNIHFYIYDHKTQSGSPFGGDNPQAKLGNIVLFNIVKSLIDISKSNGIDTPILKIDLKDIRAGYSLNDMWISVEVNDTIDILLENKIFFWVILDNLDRYDSKIQKYAFELANNLTNEYKIGAIVPIRPYTYPGNSQHLQGVCVTLAPPNLYDILYKRFIYLKSHPEEAGLQRRIDQFKSINLSLKWTKGYIKSEDELFRLYSEVISLIGNNKTLSYLLQSIRHNNIRKSLRDISHLLNSGFFAEELILTLEDNYKSSLSGEAIITSYLRGPYLRHRGRTDKYLINITNIFDIPNVDDNHKLLGIRILQLLKKYTNIENARGISYLQLKEKLINLCYPETQIKFAIRFLLERRLINEITRLIDWRKNHTHLLDSDELIISSSGNYYMSKFLKKYALRYLEAMADVYPFNYEIVKEKLIIKDKSLNSICNNAYYLANEILLNLKHEMNTLGGIRIDSNTTKLDLLFMELNSDNGFFFEMITHVNDLIERFNKHSDRIKQDVVNNWKTLQNEANKINKLKILSLEG